MSEVRGREKTEVGGRRSEDRSQRTEVRGRKSEGRSQRAEGEKMRREEGGQVGKRTGCGESLFS